MSNTQHKGDEMKLSKMEQWMVNSNLQTIRDGRPIKEILTELDKNGYHKIAAAVEQSIKIYTRIGDAGDYIEAETIPHLITIFQENNVEGPLQHNSEYGVENAEYKGNNYISLYWGIDEETPTKSLKDEELAYINRILESTKIVNQLLHRRGQLIGWRHRNPLNWGFLRLIYIKRP